VLGLTAVYLTLEEVDEGGEDDPEDERPKKKSRNN
jgi:hypothetical protein